jgi:hypothetical protein
VYKFTSERSALRKNNRGRNGGPNSDWESTGRPFLLRPGEERGGREFNRENSMFKGPEVDRAWYIWENRGGPCGWIKANNGEKQGEMGVEW